MRYLYTCPMCRATVNVRLDDYRIKPNPKRRRYYHLACWERLYRENTDRLSRARG